MRRHEQARCVFVVYPGRKSTYYPFLQKFYLRFWGTKATERQKKSGRSDWALIFQIDQHVKRIKVGLVAETLIVQPEACTGAFGGFRPWREEGLTLTVFFTGWHFSWVWNRNDNLSKNKHRKNDRQGTCQRFLRWVWSLERTRTTNEKPQVKGMQFVHVFAKIKMSWEMEVALTPVLFSAQG